MRSKLIILSFCIILSFGITGFYFRYFIDSPLNTSNEMVTYTLVPGTPSSQTVKQLREQNVLSGVQAKLLNWYIHFQRSEKLLKAGEYQFPLNITPKRLIDKLVKGEVIQYPFTIVEGSTFEQVMATFSAHEKIVQTLQGKSVQEIMTLLGVKHLSPEGQFFPETYFYTANTSDKDLLERAYRMMQKKLQLTWQERSKDIPLNSPYEALILASIIEKEAAVDEERELISGVFQQRLQKNMRLQADPTVIYGLQKQYGGKLTAVQLKQDTPYNTYLHKGLPPTPIANPGMKAIMATMHPQVTEALYFVAKGDGSHYFSATLKEHNEAVKNYQLNVKNKSGLTLDANNVSRFIVAPRLQADRKKVQPIYQIGDGL